MKVTLFDLYNQKAQEVINKLSESDKTDVLTARMVVRLLNAIKNNQEELNAVVNKLNADPAMKEMVEKSDLEKMNGVLSAELQKAEVEIDLTKLSFEQLHEAGLSPKEIYVLSWLLSDNQV